MTEKNEKVTIRLTKEEKEMLVQRAEKSGQSISAFVIHCAIRGATVPVAEKCRIYQKLQAASEDVFSEEGKKLLDEIAENVGRL